MSNLENKVKEVVTQFVSEFRLFTALDVSNEVKKTLPTARHRQVRDIVRQLYTSDLVASGYSQTTIDVTLADGSIVQAILYHDLADVWELDKKYDQQKRQQVSAKPTPLVDATDDWLSGKIDLKDIPGTQVLAPPNGFADSKVAPADLSLKDAALNLPAKTLSSKELWESLFKEKVSLFPNH